MLQLSWSWLLVTATTASPHCTQQYNLHETQRMQPATNRQQDIAESLLQLCNYVGNIDMYIMWMCQDMQIKGSSDVCDLAS